MSEFHDQTANLTASPVPMFIDCGIPPLIPGDWVVESHQQGGKIEWNPINAKLYLSPEQKGDKSVKGQKLHQKLKGQPVANANVLDWLLAHPDQIPKEWKDMYIYIFFWGTIYRNSAGGSGVRCLYFRRPRWDWYCYWFHCNFNYRDPALLLPNK